MPFPDNYEIVVRPSDGERVGLLAPSEDRWMPLNLIGFELGSAATDRDSATDLVIAKGLASLDGQWWCQAPLPFAETEAELRNPDPGWQWRRVVLVEVTPLTCAIRPALAWPEEQGRTVVLTLPARSLLRQGHPADGAPAAQ